MDWLTFFAKIIESLVWPASLVWVLYFFIYKNGTKIARLVKSIKYKDLEVSFRIDEAIKEAEKTLPVNQKPLTEDEISQVEKIAKINPALAIIEIWRTLEIEVSKITAFAHPTGKWIAGDFISTLQRNELIKSSEANLLRKLKEVRNAAVHTNYGDRITLPEIMEYKFLTDALVTKLKKISEPHS